MAIATRDSVKQMLGVTTADDDSLIDQLQAVADAFIASHCGRAFAGGTFTEYHPGGGRTLFLANFPVSAVASLKVDASGAFGPDTLRGTDTYALLADRGVIVSRGGPFGGPGATPNAVQVAYATPTDAVPPPVGRAYADLVGLWYRQAKTADHLGQLNLVSKNEAGVQTTYANGASGFRVPPAVLQVLDLYRVPTV